MTTFPFDDRDGYIWFDGKLIDWRDARIHVLSHGLHYASAVFEGERAYNGKIFKLPQHNDRLFNSAGILDMQIPFTKDELAQARYDVMKANNLTDCYLRPLVWRGPEGLSVSAANTKIHVMIAAWVWGSYFSPEKAAQGLSLQTSKWRRPSPATAPIQAKAAGGYMTGTLSKDEAMRNGFDDALMLDFKDRVAEATGANLFMVNNGVITTPPTECSLNGITRQTLIDLAREHGHTVKEEFFGYDDLIKADEIFLTGTAAEVQPVGKIDTHSINVGPVYTALAKAYGELVRR